MNLRALIILVLTFALLPAVASERISMKPSGGVYTVPVEINGALTLDFLLDTGAATVIIPADVALTLVRTGTIGPDDILGSGQYVLADGSIVENTKINLRTLQIGSRLLRNVQAAVGGVDSTLLLGQTALQQLEPWRLDTATGHFVLMERDSDSGAVAVDSGPGSESQRQMASLTPAPNPAVRESRTVYLSGWTADRNAALTGNHSPGSLDGLGVNFPLDGTGARIVACTDDPAVKGRPSVQIEISINGAQDGETARLSGTAHLSPRSSTCWTAYMPNSTLRAIKNGSMMWVSLSNRVFYRADLTGSAKAMNEAWAYVEQRLAEGN